MNKIIIRLIDAPTDLRGAVKEDADGDYNIYINARLSEPDQQRTLLHELRHIYLGHLDDDTKSIEEKENEADGGQKQPRCEVFTDELIDYTFKKMGA